MGLYGEAVGCCTKLEVLVAAASDGAFGVWGVGSGGWGVEGGGLCVPWRWMEGGHGCGWWWV